MVIDPRALRPLAEADASCGAKAHALGKLLARGLPVPDGFVIEHAVFAAVSGLAEIAPGDGEPDAGIGHALADAGDRIAHGALAAELEREVGERAAALGRLAVRSSASLEDGARGGAAGVFESVVDIAPGDVWAAVRAVWTGALTPLAVAYARRRAAPIAINVIVQRFVAGARATIYTRGIGAADGDTMWMQRGGQLERIARATAHEAAALALAAEQAIEASAGADVELVLSDPPWIVQARPIVHPPPRKPRSAPPPILLASLIADGRRWTWDVTHNPDPLSPAQAGLVEHVDRARVTPYAARVVGGYLYTAPRDDAPAPLAPARDAHELETRVAAIERELAGLLAIHDDAPLDVALEHYTQFVQVWTTQLSPLIAAAKRPLLEELERAGCPRAQLHARAAALLGPRTIVRDPVMAPAWDVAVPTFAERGVRARTHERSGQTSGVTAALALARVAADAGERDDVWFAHAQWMMRRSLRAQALSLGLRDDDVFWLALPELLQAIDPDDAARRASAARAAHARASQWDMPLIVHGEPHFDAQRPASTTLRGVGEGPRISGRVVRLATLGDARIAQRGDIIVARAITPALVMVLERCGAIVSETGGLLDHGAALARELGIPCVVGCANAWSQLSDGAWVTIDGDAGTVEIAST